MDVLRHQGNKVIPLTKESPHTQHHLHSTFKRCKLKKKDEKDTSSIARRKN